MLPVFDGFVHAVVLATAVTVAQPHPPRISGTASYYDYHSGQAAAGPALRKFLGKNWRGSTVRVCKQRTCIRIRITDFMRRDRLIDLDIHDFARFAPLSRGLTKVTITKVRQ